MRERKGRTEFTTTKIAKLSAPQMQNYFNTGAKNGLLVHNKPSFIASYRLDAFEGTLACARCPGSETECEVEQETGVILRREGRSE